MKPYIPVSTLRDLFIYIPTTGDIFRCDDERFDWETVNGYYCIYAEGRRYFAHRIAWALHYGSWPVQYVDHINRDRTDNRIANLRDVSCKINQQNTLRPLGKQYPRGVYKTYHGDYAANIYVDGVRVDLQPLCRFNTPEEAFAFYELAKQAVHPGYVKL